MTTSASPESTHGHGDLPSISITSITSIGSLGERPEGDFLTLTEVAEVLRVPVNTLRWWRQQGSGPHFFKIGRRLVTTVGELATWVEEQKNGTSPAA